MQEKPRDESRHGLLWGVAASAVIHLLLLLLGGLVDIGPVAARAPLPDSAIRFTFAPPAERDATGNAPTEPQAERVVEPAPLPPGTSFEPSVAAVPEPAPARPPTPDPAPPDERPVEAGAPPTGSELPEAGTPALPPPVPSPQPEPPVDESPAVPDLARALREFDRALTRARQREPAGPSAGGGVPQHLFVPDLGKLPATGYGVGNLEFASRDYDWSDYARQIYIAIWRAWHNRLYLTTDEFERWAFRNESWLLEDHNRITFTIERSGQVTGVAVLTPSGWVPLDASATDALEEVVLPPLPADFPREREVVRARFLADIHVRVMRRHLTALKRAGMF